MAFENLTSKFSEITRKLKGEARITEKTLKDTLREIKLVLLEADVNFKVAKEFIARIEEKALGEDVLKSLTPGQQVIKIVKDELINLLGNEDEDLKFSNSDITYIMMVGLQGTGKTTASAKLANMLRKKGKKPLLVACDIYRPAAIEQLEVLGKSLDIPVFSDKNEKDVVKIIKKAKEYAISKLCNTLIIDTAGRLQIDENLMQELVNIQNNITLTETLLVIDSLSGQDASNVANSFKDKLNITGLIFTKLDADTRGGAVLSVKKMTGKPIKLISSGEKLNDFEQFYPNRMAERILGMGDVLSLIEKAEEEFNEDEAKKLEEKIKKQKFDLNDYLEQMKKVRKMGPISSLIKMFPGMNDLGNIEVDEKELNKIEAIINSMTEKERKNHKILDASRRKRIAKGSGTSVENINKFIHSFEMMQKMMKEISNPKGLNSLMKKLKNGKF